MAATNVRYEWVVGDFVWARMKGYPPWPGRVSEHSSDMKGPQDRKGKQWIYFYGSDNYGWIFEENIWPYDEFREKYREPTRVPKLFTEAFEKLEEERKLRPDAVAPKKIVGSVSPSSHSPTVLSGTRVPVARKVSTPKKDGPARSGGLSKRLGYASSSAHQSLVKKPRLLEKHLSKSLKGAQSSFDCEHEDSLFDFANSSAGKLDGGTECISAMFGDGSSFMPDILPSTTEQMLAKKNIMPTPLKIGFLGIGIMGSGMVDNLLKSGHEVTIWNRNHTKCRELVNEGALKGNDPADVVQQCDLIFSCVSDGPALKDLVYGNCGVLQAIGPGKRFVDLSTVDIESIQDVNEAVTTRGGRFLEAPVIGSKELAKRGQLLVIASGDKTVYDDCSSCFQAIGRQMIYLGEIASATRMKLVLSLLLGTTLAGLAESLALADKLGLGTEDVLKVLSCTSASSLFLRDKGADMIHNRLAEPSCKLQIMAKDLRLAVNMSDTVDQPLHVGSAVCELFKKAKAKGYGEHDVAAVFRAADL